MASSCWCASKAAYLPTFVSRFTPDASEATRATDIGKGFDGEPLFLLFDLTVEAGSRVAMAPFGIVAYGTCEDDLCAQLLHDKTRVAGAGAD